MSFPSEILALREGLTGHEPVLIVNDFTRVSGPARFSYDGSAGFNAEEDFGVPYIKDISFIGYQNEFRRNSGEAFGRSNGNFASQVIAGNTFDYPYIHGEAIAQTGRGFVSASVGAVLAGDVRLLDYKIVDLILGKQKTTVTGNGNTGFRFTAFPDKLQKDLTEFTHHGGDLMVSGAYVLSDLYDYRSPSGSTDFARNVLGITRGEGSRSLTGSVNTNSAGKASFSGKNYSYSNNLNENQYIVENPDILAPSGSMDADVFMTFSDTALPAGFVTKKGKSRGVVMSVPFESLREKN